ncbi:MAG: LysR family transcriptional regulator [Pseudomonadota bacterium]
MNGDIRQLRQFCAVAEAKSFSQAARRLGMAQPPLSQAIARLEDGLGARLFVRTSRSVTLTEAGRLLLDQARPLLAQHERMLRSVKKAGEGAVGHLSVCFVMSAGYDLLPRVLHRFRDKLPEIAIDLLEMTTAQQVDALDSGQCHVGLLRPPVFGAAGLTVETALCEPFVVALPEQHRLAEEPIVELAALAGEGFVTPPSRLGPGLHGRLLEACLGAGFVPDIVQEANQMQTIVSLVAGGIGVALVPHGVSRLGLAGVVYRPVSSANPLPSADLALAWRPDTLRQRRYLRAFVDLVHEEAQADAGPSNLSRSERSR